MLRETDMYPPVKAFLERQGYDVKGEVGAADVVALRGDEAPVIVEMKTAMTLSLVHQGVARQALSDSVYLAVPTGRRRDLAPMRTLCRRLGLGLLSVRLADGHVCPECDPAPYRPRRFPRKRAALLREFARLAGDPNTGGARGARVTAYRQDAVKVAAQLAAGPARGADVAKATGVAGATRIMADNHYGWFRRVSRGVYTLTDTGREACGAPPGTV